MNKHSSLFCLLVSDEEKKFYEMQNAPISSFFRSVRHFASLENVLKLEAALTS
jgi:hypothetical protein